MRFVVTLSLLTLSAMLASPPATASGTSGSGGYGGGYSSGSGASPSTSRDPAAQAYSRGKSMVKKRMACKKCAYPGGIQDTPTAQKAAARVRAGEFDLKPADQEQVLYYLKSRFGA